MSKLKPPVNDNDHISGPLNAPITLVEYGDYQCPHCGRAHPIVKEVRKTLGKRLRFVYRHFPLSNVHPYALPAAVAAEAAGLQQKFWEMHDMIFEHQDQLNEFALIEFAKELELNIPTFKRNLSDQSLVELVDSHFESGVRSGVNGTPTFFINGHKHEGDFNYAAMLQAIDEQLHVH